MQRPISLSPFYSTLVSVEIRTFARMDAMASDKTAKSNDYSVTI